MLIQVGPELFRFESRRHWVDRAYSWFREHGADEHNAVAVDAKGRLCPTGAQFRRAEEEGTYPVVVYSVEPEEGADEGADEAGLSVAGMAQGELELTLNVNEHTGRLWLSRDMWEALGEAAGWAQPEQEEVDHG